MRKKREKWLDSLKGLGILFVVLGHCFPPQEKLTNYLYSFHIAIFFYISGNLLPEEAGHEKFTSYFQKKFTRLMVPYFGYGFFTYIVWLMIGRNFGVNKELAVPPLKPLLGLLYGNGFDNFLVFNISLWFLPALFSTLVIYHFLPLFFKNRSSLFVVVLLLLCLGFIDSNYGNIRLPWGINISFIAIFFVFIGQEGKAILKKIENNNILVNLCLAILFLFGGYYLQSLNSGVSFNSHSYGNLFYFVFSAVLSIFGYALLVKVLLDNKILQYLGVNSLRILALHILTFSLISAFIKYIIQIEYLTFKVSLQGRFVYFISSILLVSLYSLISDRLLVIIMEKNR